MEVKMESYIIIRIIVGIGLFVTFIINNSRDKSKYKEKIFNTNFVLAFLTILMLLVIFF